jgi:hypothetical protein
VVQRIGANSVSLAEPGGAVVARAVMSIVDILVDVLPSVVPREATSLLTEHVRTFVRGR